MLTYPIPSQGAWKTACVIAVIMIKNAYLPATIFSDKESDFLSQVIKEVADVLGFTIEQATMNNAQTLSRHEKMQASLKKAPQVWEVKESECGTIMSELQFLITTHPIVRTLGANLAECYKDASRTKFSKRFWVFICRSYPCRTRILSITFSRKQKWSSKMSAKIACKHTSSTKPSTTEMQTLSSLESANTSTCYNPKRINKAVNINSELFDGLIPTLLKTFYQMIFNWYAKMEETKR